MQQICCSSWPLPLLRPDRPQRETGIREMLLLSARCVAEALGSKGVSSFRRLAAGKTAEVAVRLGCFPAK